MTTSMNDQQIDIKNTSTGAPIFVNFYGAVMPDRKIPPVNIYDSEVNVDLGNVSQGSLDDGAGTTSSVTSFRLTFSGYPETDKELYITLSGACDKEHPDYFSHSNSENMGVSVFVSNDFGIPHTPAHPGAILGPYPLVNGAATITLLGGYISTRDNITGGTVNTTMAVYPYTKS